MSASRSAHAIQAQKPSILALTLALTTVHGVRHRDTTTNQERYQYMRQAALTDEEVVAERHDVEIMRRRHLWPYGSFLPLKHRVAIDSHGVSRTAILSNLTEPPNRKQMYVFLPEVNIYSIPAEFWTDSIHYRRGGETLLFDIIMEGWIVA
jgi:hypothetical protein